jgi:PAS domain S-box-containing protein
MDETPELMSPEELALERRAKRSTLLSLGAVALAAAVLAGLAFVYVQRERERDLVQWQVRLGIVADSRALDIGRWVDDRFAVLRDIAQNLSVQLYMTNLELNAPQADADAVEGQYLRNLINATAMREGFLAQGQTAVDANVAPTGDSGLALLDANLKPLAVTPGMPNLPPAMQGAIAQAAAGHPGLMDMRIGTGGKPVIGFAMPVYAVQGDPGVSPAVGFVVGLRVVGDTFFERLRQPGDTVPTAENLLVRETEGMIDYISPLADGTAPLKRRLAANTPDLSAAFAIRDPGDFAERRDYRGTVVLATGRAVPQTPWVVERKVDRDTALAETDRRLSIMLTVIIVTILGIAAGAIALWRHGSSIRVSRLAIRYKVASELFEGLLQFVRTITDSQPSQIVVSDGAGRISFANRQFAEAWGIAVTATKGKTLADVIGPARANPIEEINRRVLATGAKESHVHTIERDGNALVFSSEHVPIPARPRRAPEVLVVMTDVTELDRARSRSEAVFAELIAALVGLVDRRDPYAARQSARAAEVSAAIATEMGLDEAMVATARRAGQLMNVGKITVPPEILTKTGPLTESEREALANSLNVSAEIIANVPFPGPVADTIRQIAEHWDGTGPLGLEGEAILVTARIVAVANAFVAMVSTRAYRDALGFDEACDALHAKEETAFDRRPVSALINIIDNRGGAERWAHFRTPPAV